MGTIAEHQVANTARMPEGKFGKPHEASQQTEILGTNPIHRDSFVRTDQSQTSLAGKYCENRPMKDDFCKDFIRTGRGDWRAWYILHSTMI